MASPDTQHVVVNSQSVDDTSSTDVYAQQPNSSTNANGASTEYPLPTKIDANGSLQPRSTSALSIDNRSEDQTNSQGLGADHISTADSASLADVESTRDTGSVADAFDTVGSDTDTSRADLGESIKDANGVLRSAKKPTSFKAVSVTKNFLAKAVSASVASKSGEKAAPTLGATLAMPRPRLVAKSGTGLRDSPRPRAGADSPADGATVWNKNRPAPPPPTKHFTDEELKQQYGIHLASRIQADDSNKRSKWADMDDDEDDWAPETVVWVDGTKSTINPEPIPSQMAKATKTDEESRQLEIRPALTALKRPPPPTGPPKTVLRPGAAQLAKQEMANMRDSQDPKAPGMKTPAPVPVKSPWAALPPVDKTVPLTDFESLQTPANRVIIGSQDARMMDGSFSSPITREIEADTFDRGFRDSDRGPRELFNSQSGRYEPAPEGRRGSMRRDHGYRQPSVLQRPPHGDHSEAIVDSYQARGAQGDGSPWQRRRGSSFSASNMQPSERRASVGQKGPFSSASGDSRTGIVIGHDIGPQARQNDPAQDAQQTADDRQAELLRQKKIMQEKRELAIRRRREEEEKEEAAKRERIRLKLESLGLPPPDKSQPSTSPAQSDNTRLTAPVEAAAHMATSPEQTKSVLHGHSRTTPAKPHQLSNTHSDPGSQYKVHSSERSSAQPGDHYSPHKGRAYPGTSSRTPQDPSASVSKAPVSSYSSPGDGKAQPAFKSPALSGEAFATWGSRQASASNAPASNVWGPPGALRHIGNGAFDTGYTRIPPRMQNQNMDLGPNASFVAQGREVARSPSSGTRQETSPMRHQQMLSDQNLAALGLVDTPEEIYGSSTAAVGAQETHPQSMPLSPIAPPPRHPQVAPGFQPQSAQRGPAGWSQFASQASADASMAEYDPHARHTGHIASGQGEQHSQQRWKETFKQTRVQGDWTGARRELIAAHENIQGPGKSMRPIGDAPAPPITQTQQPVHHPVLSSQTVQSTVRLPESSPSTLPSGKNATRGPIAINPASLQHSRFFPASLHGGSPPPEEAGHPAYSGGDKNRPTVNLPTPRAQVRLPPSAMANMSGAPGGPYSTPDRHLYRAGPPGSAQSSDWQARFNGLFGRIPTTTAGPPSPPKTPPKVAAVPSPAPLSSSKTQAFDLHSEYSTTVSLPFQITSSGTLSEITTKPMVDDIFEGELSFGSTPKVYVPRSPVYSPGPERNGVHILRMRPVAKFDKPVDPLSRHAGADEGGSTRSISIHLPFSTSGTQEVPFAKGKRVLSEGKLKKGPFKGTKSPRIGVDENTDLASPVSSPAIKVDRIRKPSLGKGPKRAMKREASAKLQPPE